LHNSKFCYGLMALSVPVYDARKKQTSSICWPTAIDGHYSGNIHPGLLAVGYTVNTWGAPLNVSFNVKWVMLVGLTGN